jgi:ribosome-associated toxin RatA of RatAB toxin-antitoxin module
MRAKALSRSFAMLKHKQIITIPYPAYQFESVMKDVGHYEDFVPYISESKIITPYKDFFHGIGTQRVAIFDCTLQLKFPLINIKYLSQCKAYANVLEISHHSTEKLFEKLYSKWELSPINSQSCQLNYEIDFGLSNPLLNELVSYFKSLLVSQMNRAFLQRCEAIYKDKPLNVVYEVEMLKDYYSQLTGVEVMPPIAKKKEEWRMEIDEKICNLIQKGLLKANDGNTLCSLLDSHKTHEEVKLIHRAYKNIDCIYAKRIKKLLDRSRE